MNKSKVFWIILITVIVVSIVWNKASSYFAGQMTAKMRSMPIKVETKTIEEKNINIQYDYVGRIEAKDELKVVSRVNGYLQKKYYKDGDFVKKGQDLLLIEPDEYIIAVKNAEAALRRTQASYDNSLVELNRAKELIKGDYVSRSYYDNAYAKYAADKASVDAAKADLAKKKLDLSYTRIKAPFNGKIGELYITEGNYVTAQTGEIATLVSMDPIYASFTVKRDDLRAFYKSKNGVGFVDAKVSLKLSDGSEYDESGKVDFIDNEINKDLGTIMLRATFSNKNNKLIPNDFVRVILTSNYKTVVTLVPQDAVLENVNSKYVWVIDENNTAKQKDIKVNGQFEKSWIVTEGLQPGDVVISTNLQSIRSGSKVQVVESEKTEDIKTNNAESEDNEQITTNKENTK